jgi:hypothetical protein
MLKAAGAATGAVGIGIGIGTGVAASPATAASTSFAHPGMLHTRADLERMAAKVKTRAGRYTAGFAKLTANRHSQSTWRPDPQATVTRGGGGAQNYGILHRDIHTASQNALRWKITGDTAHADTARDICNAWSGTLKGIAGDSNVVLLAGIYGYQFAHVGELIRGCHRARCRRGREGAGFPSERAGDAAALEAGGVGGGGQGPAGGGS